MADSTTGSCGSCGSCDSARMQRLEDKVSRMRFWMTIGALVIVAVISFALGRVSSVRNDGEKGGLGRGGMQFFDTTVPNPNGGPQGGPKGGMLQFGPGMHGDMKVIELRGGGKMMINTEDEDGLDDAPPATPATP